MIKEEIAKDKDSIQDSNMFKMMKEENEAKNACMFTNKGEYEDKRAEYDEFYCSESTKKAHSSDYECFFNFKITNP